MTPHTLPTVPAATMTDANAESACEAVTAAAVFVLPRFGEYEGLEQAGRGGMGVVYKAWNPRLKREEAVKVIRAGAFAGPQERGRFRLEAEAAARLDHPNIVPVFGAGECEGMLFLAMRWIDGGTCAALLRGGPLPPREAARLMAKVARAVQYAHERGILHRDLKPANILLGRDGEPHVADFGLAKHMDGEEEMTLTGAVLGTPGYMAPEQARGEKELTAAVDIFGCGAVLYALLTGRPPFPWHGKIGLAREEEADAPPPERLNPAVDLDLSAVCMKCLEADPRRRYATAAEVADDLERYLSGERTMARPLGLWGQVTRAVLRQQFSNVTAWGWINLLSGCISTTSGLLHAWAVSSRQPVPVFLGIVAGGLLAQLVLLWSLLRRETLRTGDRHALALWAGLILAVCLLPIVYRPQDGGDLTAFRYSLFPIQALFYGLLFFAFANPYWGGFYLVGASYFVLAIFLRRFPEWSPLVFTLYQGSVSVALGLYMLQMGRAPRSPER